jgi:hypothetical protein
MLAREKFTTVWGRAITALGLGRYAAFAMASGVAPPRAETAPSTLAARLTILALEDGQRLRDAGRSRVTASRSVAGSRTPDPSTPARLGAGFLARHLEDTAQDMKLAGARHVLELQKHVDHILKAVCRRRFRLRLFPVADREVNNFLAQ